MPPDPPAAGRRRRRLSDRETEQRMMDAAIEAVDRSGLTVSLDHLSLEEIIHSAGVARSAVYRRWPYKDLFFGDLLVAVARRIEAPAGDQAHGPVELLRALVSEDADTPAGPDVHDGLESATRRHDLVVELVRRGALADFDRIRRSSAWRTYIALHASFQGLTDGRVRDEVHRALAESEHRGRRGIADAYRLVTSLLGYRIRPQLDADFETLADVMSATMRGMVIMAVTGPEAAERRFEAAPFGATRAASWSHPALAVGSIAFGFLEPDPAVEWDAERTARMLAALTSEEDASRSGTTSDA